jgi:hypothetical protein
MLHIGQIHWEQKGRHLRLCPRGRSRTVAKSSRQLRRLQSGYPATRRLDPDLLFTGEFHDSLFSTADHKSPWPLSNKVSPEGVPDWLERHTAGTPERAGGKESWALRQMGLLMASQSTVRAECDASIDLSIEHGLLTFPRTEICFRRFPTYLGPFRPSHYFRDADHGGVTCIGRTT